MMTTKADTSTAEVLCGRLQRGQQWLREQRLLWLAGNPRVVSDERFSAALAAWDALERVFRCSGYTECIWGPGRSCPDDAPGLCDGCARLKER